MDENRSLLTAPRVQIALVTALFMLALFLLVTTVSAVNQFGSPTAPASDTITVNGMGQVLAAPDIAHLTFTVLHDATMVANAQAATTKQANDVLAYLKEQGIAESDVTTLSYSISPQYSYGTACPAGAFCPQGSPKITGYEVSETVQVTVHDLTKVGALLGGLGGQGVQNISGPDFALNDPTVAQNQARAQAIQKAKAQAIELARELGVRLVRIVNFSEGGNYPVPYAQALNESAGSVAGAPVPEVPTGQNQYTANVSITYEIR